MIHSKQCGRSVDIQGKLGRGRMPGTQDGAAVIPKKEWQMRRRDSTGEAAVVPEKKKRGRPPIPRPVTPDTGASETRRSIDRAAKVETFMIPIDSATEYTAIPGKRKRGRPPLCRAFNVDIPKMEQSEHAIGNPYDDGKLVEKRGRGRPLGSLSKKVQNKPSTSFKGLLGPKRGRGRPRKTELQLLNEMSKGPDLSALTKQISVRLTKMNENIVMMAGRRVQLKVENDTITVENEKEEETETMEATKDAKQKTMEELDNVMREKKKRKSAETAASVTVVLEKRRGRPRKQQPYTETHQITLSCPNTWPHNVKYEASQEAGQLPSDFTSHGQEAPAEMGVVTRDLDLLQVPQETYSPSVDPQGSWENEEVQMHQYPEWEAKPAQTVWTTEDGVDSLDSNSVTQFVVGEPTTPPPSQPPLPAQPGIQEDLLRGLSDFRCQLTRELEATRVEMREGAEMVRSAIAGVSAEIHRLGLILQPLVNVIATGNLFRRPTNVAPMTSLLHPQQETPPDDTMDVPQTATPQKNSFASRHEDPPLDHLTPRDTPTECSTESIPEMISSVKTEDLTDNPQPCTYQAQSMVDTPISQSLFLPHHDVPKVCSMRSSHKAATSAIPDFCASIPPPNMCHINSLDYLHEDSACTHSAHLSDHEAPTADSLRPVPEVTSPASHCDFMDRSSQRDSPPIISVHHNNHDQSTVRSIGSPHVHLSPARSSDCCTQDLFPYNFEEHPERDTNSVHHQCTSPSRSPGSFQGAVDEVPDCPSFVRKTPENAQDATVPNLSTSPVTVPGSSTASSAVMAQDQVEMNLEEISLKETVAKSSQDLSGVSRTAETCAFPQFVCVQPKMCNRMSPNFDVTSQSPPTSPLSPLASLLPLDGEIIPMLQSVAD